MTHIYPIAIDHLEDDVVDELVIKAMKQARISTRRHGCKWRLNVSEASIEVSFMDEYDFDDFELARYKKNKAFMEAHEVVNP